MNADSEMLHAKRVDDWIEQNTAALSTENLLLIFAEAIRAIQSRAAISLSEVTLAAIFDRVLHTGQTRFPILATVSINAREVTLGTLLDRASDLDRAEIIAAFRFLLVDLLILLGNLTGDILTKPLYRELFKVTGKSTLSSPKSSHRGLRNIKSGSDRGEV